ncbi:MAG: hypothetical protein ACOH1Y_09020 [Propionicimonas sp.]
MLATNEVPVEGYGDPQQYAASHAPVPSAEEGDVVPAAPRRRRGLIVLIAALAVVLIGGGVAAAGGYFGWYGGGSRHPSDVLPGSAVAYLQIDLNPSPAQKVQAWGFLRDLPEVRDFTGVGGPDPKRLAWDLLKERIPVVDGAADYDRDVAPWLGDRLGFAVVRNDQDAVLVIAIQVTDEAKGAAKLREWIAASHQAYAVTTRDGYALITTTEAAGFVSDELAKGVLSANPAFATDLRSVGDTGVMAGWSDLAGLSRITYGYTDDRSGDVQGRAAFALRFSPDAMEFAGKLVGWNYPSVPGAGELGNLPASTGAAISVSGGATGLKLAAPWIGLTADSWESEFGLDKADLAALLGRNLSISLPSSALADSFSSQPTVGLRVVSDDAARAQRVLHRISTEGLLSSTLTSDRVDGNVLTAASTEAYLEELAGSKDKLSGVALFTRAVPDHVRAVSAVYVSLEPILAHSVEAGSPYEPFVKALRALGGEYLDEGSGNGSWLVRVVRT